MDSVRETLFHLKKLKSLQDDLILLQENENLHQIVLKPGLSPCFVRFGLWIMILFPKNMLEFAKMTRYMQMIYTTRSKNRLFIARVISAMDTLGMQNCSGGSRLYPQIKQIFPGRLAGHPATPLLHCIQESRFSLFDVRYCPSLSLIIADEDIVFSGDEIRRMVLSSTNGFDL